MYITPPQRMPFVREVAGTGRPSLIAMALRYLPTPWPKAVRPRSRTDEAAEVRALAWRVRDTDPGFASDLLAAADRHETAGG
jgi:hypothetical protein